MSINTRYKLSAAAWGGAIFCAFWLLMSAQAAVHHFNAQQDQVLKTPEWTIKVLVPDNTH